MAALAADEEKVRYVITYLICIVLSCLALLCLVLFCLDLSCVPLFPLCLTQPSFSCFRVVLLCEYYYVSFLYHCLIDKSSWVLFAINSLSVISHYKHYERATYTFAFCVPKEDFYYNY